MKQILLLVFLLLSFNLTSQVYFSPEENLVIDTLNLSDEFATIQAESFLLNDTPDTVSLKWEIVKINGPEEWEVSLFVSGAGGGTFIFGATSNIDDDFGLNIPLPIPPEDVSYMFLTLRPNTIAGCGTYKIRVTPVSDTTNLLATGYYDYRINTTPDCTTSTFDPGKKNIEIFPNPATGYFTLTENDFVKEIQIFNIVGKRMKTVAFQNGQAIHVSSFPNGLYLVRMLDKNGEVLKTTRLTKR